MRRKNTASYASVAAKNDSVKHTNGKAKSVSCRNVATHKTEARASIYSTDNLRVAAITQADPSVYISEEVYLPVR